MSTKTAKSKLRRRDAFFEQLPLIGMLAPFLIFFCLFTIIPIFSSIYLSFTGGILVIFLRILLPSGLHPELMQLRSRLPFCCIPEW